MAIFHGERGQEAPADAELGQNFPSPCEQQGNSSSDGHSQPLALSNSVDYLTPHTTAYLLIHQKHKEKMLPPLSLTWCQLRPLAAKAVYLLVA